MQTTPTKPERAKTPKADAAQNARDARAALKLVLTEWGEDAYAKKLDDCETPLKLICLGCMSSKLVESGCSRRWCPVCARKISAERTARFLSAVERMSSPIFVTLTIQNVAEARAGIRGLRNAFGKFKRRKWFQSLNVAGGIAALEITNRGAGWHPHLHIVLDCQWLAPTRLKPQPGDTKAVIKAKCAQSQAELSDEWASCTGQNSAIVWVKKADAGIVHEVLKYSVKPSDLIACSDNPGDLIRAMEGTRLVTTWGTCYGIAAEQRKKANEERTPCKCENCQAANWMPEAVWSSHYGRIVMPPRTTRGHERQRANAGDYATA